MNQPIALSDYLRTVQAPGRVRRQALGGTSEPLGGEADPNAQTTPQDFTLEGRVALANSPVPGMFGKVAGLTGLPGSLMGLGIQAALAHNLAAAQNQFSALAPEGRANLDLDTQFGLAQALNIADPALGKQSEAFQAQRSSERAVEDQGTGLGFGQPGPGIAAAMADAAAASAAATAAAADSTGVGPAGVGGFGDAYHTGGLVRDRRPGMNEPITAQQGEYVIKRSAVKHYGQSLLDAINRAEADVKVVRKPRDLKTALTTSRT